MQATTRFKAWQREHFVEKEQLSAAASKIQKWYRNRLFVQFVASKVRRFLRGLVASIVFELWPWRKQGKLFEIREAEEAKRREQSKDLKVKKPRNTHYCAASATA